MRQTDSMALRQGQAREQQHAAQAARAKGSRLQILHITVTTALDQNALDQVQPQEPANDCQTCEDLYEPDYIFEHHKDPISRANHDAPILLETRGLTSHIVQTEFLAANFTQKASIAAKLREIGQLERAHRLDQCHTLKSFAVCRGCRSARMFWNRCDTFYCPTCQPRLARERRESVEWWITSIKDPKHLVLTIPNTEHIGKIQFKWLKSCLSRLRRSKCARNWKGGLYSFEVTNRGFGWHPHIHLIVDTKWIDKPALSKAWASIIEQPIGIIHISDARQRNYAKEVTKYVCKGNEMAKWEPAQIIEFILAIEGLRTFGVFGSLYGKRTEWRDFLDGLHSKATTCECGCNLWRILTEDEYKWEIETQHAAEPPRPPPAPRTTAPQFAFASTETRSTR